MSASESEEASISLSRSTSRVCNQKLISGHIRVWRSFYIFSESVSVSVSGVNQCVRIGFRVSNPWAHQGLKASSLGESVFVSIQVSQLCRIGFKSQSMSIRVWRSFYIFSESVSVPVSESSQCVEIGFRVSIHEHIRVWRSFYIFEWVGFSFSIWVSQCVRSVSESQSMTIKSEELRLWVSRFQFQYLGQPVCRDRFQSLNPWAHQSRKKLLTSLSESVRFQYLSQ